MLTEMMQARENSSVFRQRLKVESTAMHLSSDGKLFQALGPVTAKDRWPSPVATRGTS